MKKTTTPLSHANITIVQLGIFVTAVLASELVAYLANDRVSTQIANVSIIALAGVAGALLGKTISSRFTTAFTALFLSFIAVTLGTIPVGYSLVAAFLVAIAASHPYLHAARPTKKAMAIGVGVAVTTLLLFFVYMCSIMAYSNLIR